MIFFPFSSWAFTFYTQNTKHLEILTYEQLADQLANDCHGFSGAAIAGVTRAAASRALARSVGRLSGDLEFSSDDDDDSPSSIMDCLVTQDDFYQAINDVRGRSGNNGYASAKDEGVVNGEGNSSDGRIGKGNGKVIGGFRSRHDEDGLMEVDPSRETNQNLEMENMAGGNQSLQSKLESLEEVVEDLRKNMKTLLEQNEELKRHISIPQDVRA